MGSRPGFQGPVSASRRPSARQNCSRFGRSGKLTLRLLISNATAFLMNSPEANYEKNDQTLQAVINTLKVTGKQSPQQRASK